MRDNPNMAMNMTELNMNEWIELDYTVIGRRKNQLGNQLGKDVKK